MAIQKFEDIIAWQKAQDLAVDIYNSFRNINDYSFRKQICSAATSISNNIDEGFDRSSDADFSRFLYIAIASCSETTSMLYLAERVTLISTEEKTKLINLAEEVSKIIRGLIKSLKK